MRVSTSMIYDQGTANLNRQTAAYLKTQNQLATGRRMVNPSDDPVAAARALEVTQRRDMNAQFLDNQNAARDALRTTEISLTSLGDLLQYVREDAMKAGNASLDDSQRRMIATDLRQQFGQLLSIANAKDSNGEFLFAGFGLAAGETQPYEGSVEAGVTANGDQGQRKLQVSAGRQLTISNSGYEVFENVDRVGGGKQSVFDTVRNLITALETPGAATTSAALSGRARQHRSGAGQCAARARRRRRAQCGTRRAGKRRHGARRAVPVDALGAAGSRLQRGHHQCRQAADGADRRAEDFRAGFTTIAVQRVVSALRRPVVACAIAAALLAAGCSSISGEYPRSSPVIPAASIRFSEGYAVSLEKLVTYAGVATAVYLVLDPLAPNWRIEQTQLPDDSYLLSLRMKRFHTGGDGEARQVFHRRARELARSNGYSDYEVTRFDESLDSAMLGSQRTVEASIRLTGKSAMPIVSAK